GLTRPERKSPNYASQAWCLTKFSHATSANRHGIASARPRYTAPDGRAQATDHLCPVRELHPARLRNPDARDLYRRRSTRTAVEGPQDCSILPAPWSLGEQDRASKPGDRLPGEGGRGGQDQPCGQVAVDPRFFGSRLVGPDREGRIGRAY